MENIFAIKDCASSQYSQYLLNNYKYSPKSLALQRRINLKINHYPIIYWKFFLKIINNNILF